MAVEPAMTPHRPRWQRWIAPGLVGLAALTVAAIVLNGRDRVTPTDVEEAIDQALADAAEEPPRSSAAEVYELVVPSVVIIQSPEADIGAGVVITSDGRVMTALHLIEDLDPIQLVFADGTQTTAAVETSDPATDIAVLVPNRLPDLLVPAVLASPRSLRGGEAVFAIGSPFGLSGSISSGFVSGLNRSVPIPDTATTEGEPTLDGLIQFDASISAGYSGGPLVNVQGQVIGIVTTLANASGDGTFDGIGFAVPIDIAGGIAGSPSQ